MSSNAIPDTASLPEARIKVPQHVVYRGFPAETVVLNLNTGRYHGLNVTAGHMLDALKQARSVRDAAVAVAERYEQPHAVVEKDMCELCQLLLDRGLVEIDVGPAG
jgi:hypothetical protein